MNNVISAASGLLEELKVVNDSLEYSEKERKRYKNIHDEISDEYEALRECLCMTKRGGELLIKFDKEYEENGE